MFVERSNSMSLFENLSSVVEFQTWVVDNWMNESVVIFCHHACFNVCNEMMIMDLERYDNQGLRRVIEKGVKAMRPNTDYQI